jgi:hypothetical protein
MVTLLVAAAPGSADTGSAADGWSASGAALSASAVAGPTGNGVLAAAMTSSAGTMQLAGSSTGAAIAGARGWIRATTGSGAVATVTLADSGRRLATSAPLHLSPQWQTFGVTLAHPAAGALNLAVGTQAAGGWPVGTALEVSAVSLGDTGRSTLTRASATTNYFNLTPYGGAAAAFVAHGYDYGPSPIGATIGTPWEDPTTCQSDAQILGGAGVTMVASAIDSAAAFDVATDPDGLVKCADAFWARGVGFAWLFAIQSVPADGAGFVQDYETKLQLAIALLGDHPATYTWLVGNEMNLSGRDGACFFDQPCSDPTGGHYLAQLVDYLHANDAGHPVSTKISGDGGGGCTSSGVISPSDVQALDYWSDDDYPATSFGSFFSCLQSEDNTRPVLMTEFGQGRWFCNGLDTAHLGNAGAYSTVNYLCPPGSHEDDSDAQTANTSLWQGILGDIASPTTPGNELLGGTEFMYSDLWWFSWGLPFQGGEAYPPTDHAVIATYCGCWYPNGWWSPEWAGAAQAQTAAQAEEGQPRVTTPEVAAISQLWGKSPPSVSNVSMVPGGTPTTACTVTVTWTSATPATTVVDWGVQNILLPQAFFPVHDVYADDTEYAQQFQDSTLTTTHSFTIPGPVVDAQGALLPGSTYRIAVGGFDATSGSDMSAGTNVTVPALSCA